MKAPEDFFFSSSTNNSTTTWWRDERTVSLCKAGHDPKAFSTLIPNGASSKFTNMYRSPRLAGSLPLSCGDNRESFLRREILGLTGQLCYSRKNVNPNFNSAWGSSRYKCCPWLQYLHKSLNSAFCYVQIGSAQMGALVH